MVLYRSTECRIDVMSEEYGVNLRQVFKLDASYNYFGG